MQKEILIQEPPVAAGKYCLTIFARVTMHVAALDGVVYYSAVKHPVYVLVSSDDGTRAFNLDGEELSDAKLGFKPEFQ